MKPYLHRKFQTDHKPSLNAELDLAGRRRTSTKPGWTDDWEPRHCYQCLRENSATTKQTTSQKLHKRESSRSCDNILVLHTNNSDQTVSVVTWQSITTDSYFQQSWLIAMYACEHFRMSHHATSSWWDSKSSSTGILFFWDQNSKLKKSIFHMIVKTANSHDTTIFKLTCICCDFRWNHQKIRNKRIIGPLLHLLTARTYISMKERIKWNRENCIRN